MSKQSNNWIGDIIKHSFTIKSTLTRRRFLRLAGLGTAGAIVSVTGAGLTQTLHVVVERHEIELARLPRELDGLKVAHLSDFHYTSVRDAEVIRAAVRATNELCPDIVVLTGDYVTAPIHGSGFSNSQCATPCAQILSDLNAPLGVFAVLGNNDQFSSDFVSRSLDNHGVMVLRNHALYVERAGARLWIAGVDDVLEGKSRLDETLRAVAHGEATVLLAHEPDYADVVREYSVDLQLSGHSHGGQIRVPFVGSLLLPALGRKYPIGLRKLGPLTLYTNRGLGTVLLPVRIDCPPEVTLLTLRSGAPTVSAGSRE
jgi:predicted MPP superfamily phosphohydrolase